MVVRDSPCGGLWDVNVDLTRLIIVAIQLVSTKVSAASFLFRFVNKMFVQPCSQLLVSLGERSRIISKSSLISDQVLNNLVQLSR